MKNSEVDKRLSEANQTAYRALNKSSRATAFIEDLAARYCRLCSVEQRQPLVGQAVHIHKRCAVKAAREFLKDPIKYLNKGRI